MKLPKAPRRTAPGFVFPMVERALQACLATRQFGQEEMAKVLGFFGTDPPECVYCGSHEVRRWDHLVPVREGGETVLGNMVPACARCDDSKRNLSFEEWIKSEVKLSPKSRGVQDLDQRVQRIKAYVRHFGYTRRSLEERLDEEELARLTSIRSRLQGIREEIEMLVEDFGERTSNT